MEKFEKWFWKISQINPDTLGELNASEKALVDILPYVIGITLMLGFFIIITTIVTKTKESEKDFKEITVSELDKEIALIRKKQGL